MIWQVSPFPCQDWTSPFLVGALKHQNSKFRPHNGRKPINQELPEWKIFGFHYDTRMAKWQVMGRAIHMPLTSFMPLASFMRKLLIRLHAFQQFKTVKCHKAFTLNLAYRIRQDLWTINTPPPKKKQNSLQNCYLQRSTESSNSENDFFCPTTPSKSVLNWS